MKLKPKWTLADILRLELLVYRHRAARASGRERQENEVNQEIYNKIVTLHPSAVDSRRCLLKHWMEHRWKSVPGSTAEAFTLAALRRGAWVTTLAAFVIGLLVHFSWGALMGSINVLAVLASHAILPLLLFVFFIAFGNTLSLGQNGASLWQRLCLFFRSGRRTLTQKADDHAERTRGSIHERSAVAAPFLKAYLWIYLKIYGLLLPRHEQQEEPSVGEEIESRAALAARQT